MSDYFKKRAKGYLTVEASMLVPLVVLLIALLLYLSFFLYNRCILTQDAYILAFRGSIQKEEREVQKYIEECSKVQFSKKYAGMKNIEKNIAVSNKKITVKISGVTSNNWLIEKEAEAERINPAKVIRKIRLIKKAANKMENIECD